MVEEVKRKRKTKTQVVEVPARVERGQPRLLEFYLKEGILKLKERFQYKNVMQVPRLEKIVINCGLGSKAIQNIKVIEQATQDIIALTGQKPVVTKSKKAIASFKLRKGLSIGVMVTLRGKRMYEFFDRLLSLVLPRIRDFRGVSEKGFDSHGNYTLGLKDQLVFPEVKVESAENIFGMNITFITTALTDEEGRGLLEIFGFPFRKQSTPQKKAA